MKTIPDHNFDNLLKDSWRVSLKYMCKEFKYKDLIEMEAAGKGKIQRQN